MVMSPLRVCRRGAVLCAPLLVADAAGTRPGWCDSPSGPASAAEQDRVICGNDGRARGERGAGEVEGADGLEVAAVEGDLVGVGLGQPAGLDGGGAGGGVDDRGAG